MPTVTQPAGSVTQPAEQVIQPETPQVMAPRPGENVTLPRYGETVSGQETAVVKSLTKLIKENIPAVADMPSVAEVKGNELPTQGTVTERLLGFIRSIGGKVTRHGFGDVLFSKNRIKGSVIGHGIGNAKIETFAAVPQVIQQGKQVDHQSNWKGRGYDTYTFMAPITYRGNPTYLGVIVAKDNNSNRYYLHEVADEDGNIIYTNRGTPDSAPDARASQTGAYDSVAENEVPAPIIPQEAMTVNGVMAPRPGEEIILPGGANNGEQTQDIQRNGNGTEAAVAGEDTVYGGDAGGGSSYADAGRPESVRPPAGVKGATRENRALTFQRQKAATDQPYISPASLGIDGGGEEATMRILAPDDWDDELRGLNSWLGDKGIREVHMVVGTITVDNGGGPVDVLDVIKKDTGELFLRVDSLSRSATETGVHAAGHYMADEEKITRFMNAVKSRKNAVWEPMYEKYMQKWAQVTNYYEGMTEAEKELYVWEEILGDAYANINNMGTRASAFHDIAEAVLEGTGEPQTGSEVSLAEGENAAAAAGIRGPPRYMTAGESGKNADLDALATAKAMQQEGASEESILALTGWYQGSDGKWRWEIDDSDMTYHRGGDAAFSQNHADYAEYQELMRKWMTGDVTAEEETRLQKLDETWGREYGRLSERVDRGNATLEDILDHEALFRAYPQLRQTKVEFADLQRETRGSYSPSGNKITLSNELRGAPQETLVHEIQHAIQKVEGFSGGSSPKYWEERLTSGDEIQSKGFQDAREKLIRFQLDEANEEALALKDKIEQAGELDDDLTEYDRLWEEAERRGLDGKINEYYDLRDNYYTQMNRPGNSVPSELYYNTAGEIEARDTANRWKMTAEERRNSLPYRGDENTVFADGGENLDYVGGTVDGTEVYETSEAILKLPYKQRMEAFMDIMRNEYAGRTAKFTARDGEIYYATFDENDLRKNVYGDKKSSSRGWKAKINTGADGNIFDLVENAEHSGSGKEQGKTSEAHQGLTGWEYFVKTVQIDGRVYDLLANVRKKPDGEFVYSIQLNENKKKAPAPPRQYQNGTAKAENRPVGVPTDASKTSVAEGETGVKGERDALKGYFDENGRFVLPRAAEEDAADEAPKRTANRYSVDDEQDAAEKKKKKEVKPAAKSRPIIAKKELRQNMMNIFSIPAGSKNMLGDMVDQVADKLLETGTLSWEERKEFFDRMYDSGVMTVAADEYSRDARDVVLKRKIYVPESVKHEFGGSEDYNEFRKTAFAAGVYLTNNKSDEHIDTLNMELAERLPGLFDANDLDMTEILKTVVQVAEEGKGEKMSLADTKEE